MLFVLFHLCDPSPDCLRMREFLVGIPVVSFACLSSRLSVSKIGMEDSICMPGWRKPGMEKPWQCRVIKTESVGGVYPVWWS